MNLKRLIVFSSMLVAVGACSDDDPVEPSPTPTITLISPNTGPATGGTTVTIAGSGFTGTPTVTFGSTAATGVTVNGGVSITATVPAGSPGAVSVTVANADGKSGSLANGYTYIGSPTVTSVTPSNGTTLGGNTVTITGTGFAAVPTVTFGGTAATNVSFTSSTSITAVAPAHAAGAVAVVVRNPDTQQGTLNNGYTYNAPPVIATVTPNSGPAAGGTAVTIAGTGFTTGATVTIGGTAATAITVGAGGTSITATTPARPAGPATIVVTNPDGQGTTLTNGFTYNASPTVTSVTPNSATINGGVTVTVAGTGFAGTPTVSFGGTNGTNVVVANSTQLTVTAPARAAGVVGVTVTNADGQSGTLANAFTYRAPPTVTSASPNTGPALGGAAVTVNGTGFAPGATVTIGGTAATNVVVAAGGASLTLTTPARPPGAATIVVTNPDGQTGQLANAYTYVAGPTITSVNPNTGSTAGGLAVVINGTGFTPGATVFFGGTAATGVTVTSATRLDVILPARTSGGAVDVLVTNTDGQFFRSVGAFTYVSPPTITSVTPAEGAPIGGAEVVIVGTGFVEGATVAFGGTAATNVVFENSTRMRATTPARPVGAVTVTVTNPDGQVASRANGFNYIGPVTLFKDHWRVDLTWENNGAFTVEADFIQNGAIVLGSTTYTSGPTTYTVQTNGTISGNIINVTFNLREGTSPRGSFTCVATITGTGASQRMTGTFSSTDFLLLGGVASQTGVCQIQ